MPKRAIQFSIVLPCYNEAQSLEGLLEAYAQVWRDLPSELILVNNGSTDGTSETLERLVADPAYSFARIVTVPKNRGYGHGLMAGLRAAEGRIVGFSHADLQCSPADLFVAYDALVDAGAPGSAIVKGRRQKRSVGPSLITNGMAVIASMLLGRALSDINAQPKVFHRTLLDRLKSPPEGFEFDVYVLHRALENGARIHTIPVVFHARPHGSSKWAATFRSRWLTIARVIGYLFELRFGPAR
jgi:glycosyltransferase involved in cell wall biosynthesis